MVEIAADRISAERLQKQELYLQEQQKELDEARRQQSEYIRSQVQKQVTQREAEIDAERQRLLAEHSDEKRQLKVIFSFSS